MLKVFLEKHCPLLFSTRTYLAYGVEGSPTRYTLDKTRYLLNTREILPDEGLIYFGDTARAMLYE